MSCYSLAAVQLHRKQHLDIKQKMSGPRSLSKPGSVAGCWDLIYKIHSYKKYMWTHVNTSHVRQVRNNFSDCAETKSENRQLMWQYQVFGLYRQLWEKSHIHLLYLRFIVQHQSWIIEQKTSRRPQIWERAAYCLV